MNCDKIQWDAFTDGHREAHRYLYKTDLLTKLQKCTEIENFEKRSRSLLVVVATPPTDNYEKFTQKVNEFNSKEPFNFTMPSLFTQQKNYTKVCMKIYWERKIRVHVQSDLFFLISFCFFSHFRSLDTMAVCYNLCGLFI